MPLFSNKFSPLKLPQRKSDNSNLNKEVNSELPSHETGLEYPPIRLNLGGQEIVFQDGQWIPANGSTNDNQKENIKLKKSLKVLEEENNMLKLKFEILLDMLTQTTAESQLQLKEIDQLKQALKLRKY